MHDRHDWRLYIDGRWRGAMGDATHTIVNPASEGAHAEAPDASLADLEQAVVAARRAFDHGPWPRLPLAERIAALERIADGVEARREQFLDILVSVHAAETPTHWMQVDAPVQLLRGYAELAKHFPFEERMDDATQATPGGDRNVASLLVRQPVGVCALLPTWNFPLWVSCQKLGPALVCGCTMVVKPPPVSPLIDLLLGEIIEEAGVPPGVVNVIPSASVDVSRALVSDARIDLISFTGSNQTGKSIMQLASKNLTRCHLELGGKSALIVLDDCDLDEAAAAAAMPVAVHAGQGCALMTRVLVARDRHDQLVEKMKDYIEKNITVGDPSDPEVTLGPVISAERRSAIEGLIASGLAEGAELVTGGGRPKGLEQGYYVEPTLFAHVRNDMRIAREEIFGPVICVIPFDTEAEAIELANDSSYGLFGGIMTADPDRAIELAKQLRVGGVSINGATNTFHKPSGGFKESGLGRENGRFGIEAFTELQVVMSPLE